MNGEFVVAPEIYIDRVIGLLLIAFIGALWCIRRPGMGRLLLIAGALVAALASLGAGLTDAGGIVYTETLVAVERRAPSLVWMLCTALDAGGRLTAIIGFAWSVLKDDPPSRSRDAAD